MTWADLAALAQDATRSVFAESATYTPLVGAPVAIVGEFDAAAVQIDLAGGVAVQSVGPRLSVRLTDLPGDAAEVGAEVVVRSVTYAVTEIEPDGHGMALLRLSRV